MNVRDLRRGITRRSLKKREVLISFGYLFFEGWAVTEGERSPSASAGRPPVRGFPFGGPWRVDLHLLALAGLASGSRYRGRETPLGG